MTMIKMVGACAMLVFGGCGYSGMHSTNLLVPNTEKYPIVTVVPFNNEIAQIEAARSIEMELVNHGFCVISYNDGGKDVEKRTDTANTQEKTDAGDVAKTDKKESMIERYHLYEGTRADVIFEVLARYYSNTVRAVRVKDGVVLGVVNLSSAMSKDDFKKFLLEKKLASEKPK